MECSDLALFQQMRDEVYRRTILMLEHSAKCFQFWKMKKSIEEWCEARRKKQEEEDQRVMTNLSEEIMHIAQEAQRVVIIYQPQIVQVTHLQQIELQHSQSSPTLVSPSSSTAPELTSIDIQQMIDAKIQTLEAKFEERLSRVEEQAKSNYAKLIEALKKGEKRQKKEAKKARKKEDKARRQAFEEQLKLMQEMAAISKRKKDDAEEKEG